MNSRWARVARGTIAAGFATFVAAFSHVVAGGQVPSLFGMAASLVISTMLCTILTSRAPSLWRLAASVALSQALFHALFSGLGTPVPVAHDMAAMGAVTSAPHLHADGPMWGAHAIAGVVTLVALRYAEGVVWGAAQTVALFLARLFQLPTVPRLELPGSAPEAAARPLRAAAPFLSSMSYRGPPLEPRTV